MGFHSQMRAGIFSLGLKLGRAKEEEKEKKEKASEILSFLGLEGVREYLAVNLSFGQQRLLELARALASSPKMLLLDEPASGLNAVETQQLGELLQQIRARGITLLLVEHDMDLTMSISDKIVVLHQGQKLAEGTPREIQCNDEVICAYLGSDQEMRGIS
jgi:branched-chain amino acid transport system ATP-binding protein